MIAFAMVAVAAGGCSSRVPVNVPVGALEGTFPTIERLGVVAYEHRTFNAGEPACRAIIYSRGGFTSIPTSTTCGSFDGIDAPRLPFDGQAESDIGTLETSLANAAPSFRWIRITYAGDAVGAGSQFAVDGCVIYVYARGLAAVPTSIPGVSEVSAAGPNWARINNCP